MKKCLKCGVEYQDDDIFCPVCGGRRCGHAKHQRRADRSGILGGTCHRTALLFISAATF